MGEVGQFVREKLEEVWGHIGDRDGEAFDGGAVEVKETISQGAYCNCIVSFRLAPVPRLG